MNMPTGQYCPPSIGMVAAFNLESLAGIVGIRIPLWRHVNAVSIFLTCAEVKFPRPPISVISRQGDHELRFWEADRDGAEAVLGLAH